MPVDLDPGGSLLVIAFDRLNSQLPLNVDLLVSYTHSSVHAAHLPFPHHTFLYLTHPSCLQHLLQTIQT